MFLIFDVRKTDWLVKQFTLNRKVNGKRFTLFRDQTRSKISVVISLKCNLFEKNVIKANENPKISRFQSTCQVHNWKSHFWKTQVYHYSQHPDPVFFRRNVTVVDHYRTWNQTWRILIFFGTQKFLLRNAVSRDFPKRVEMMDQMSFFEEKQEKFQNVFKRNRLTTQNYVFWTISHFGSNLLWLGTYWELSVYHKHWFRTFSVNKTRLFWKVKWGIHDKNINYFSKQFVKRRLLEIRKSSFFKHRGVSAKTCFSVNF